MNIKVATFTVSEKSINTFIQFRVTVTTTIINVYIVKSFSTILVIFSMEYMPTKLTHVRKYMYS